MKGQSTMSESLFEKFDGHRVAKIIYGTIIVLVVIVTLEDHPPSPTVAIGSVLGASIAVALAEFYSELIGKRIHEKRRLSTADTREIMSAVSAVLIGALLPLPILILAWLDLVSIGFALILNKWLLVGLIIFYGYAAAAVSGSGRLWATFSALLAGTIGLTVVLIKAALSH
jgi:hypothetical protein